MIRNVGGKEGSVRYGVVVGFGGKHSDMYCCALEFIWNVENVGWCSYELGQAGSPNPTKNNAFLQFLAVRDGTKMNT